MLPSWKTEKDFFDQMINAISEKVAILVDGGFYQCRAKALWGKAEQTKSGIEESGCHHAEQFIRQTA